MSIQVQKVQEAQQTPNWLSKEIIFSKQISVSIGKEEQKGKKKRNRIRDNERYKIELEVKKEMLQLELLQYKGSYETSIKR